MGPLLFGTQGFEQWALYECFFKMLYASVRRSGDMQMLQEQRACHKDALADDACLSQSDLRFPRVATI